MTKILLVASVLLAGCGLRDVGGGAGFNFDGLTGEVFLCSMFDLMGNMIEQELCWKDGNSYELDDSLDNHYDNASCIPTPRHLGPCLYHCDGGGGCNAKQGCWCPQ